MSWCRPRFACRGSLTCSVFGTRLKDEMAGRQGVSQSALPSFATVCRWRPTVSIYATCVIEAVASVSRGSLPFAASAAAMSLGMSLDVEALADARGEFGLNAASPDVRCSPPVWPQTRTERLAASPLRERKVPCAADYTQGWPLRPALCQGPFARIGRWQDARGRAGEAARSDSGSDTAGRNDREGRRYAHLKECGDAEVNRVFAHSFGHEHRPVTPEAVGSSPVHPANSFFARACRSDGFSGDPFTRLAWAVTRALPPLHA